MYSFFGYNTGKCNLWFPHDKALSEALQGIDDFYDKKKAEYDRGGPQEKENVPCALPLSSSIRSRL